MLRGWSREDKRISAVWILPGVSGLLRVLLALFIGVRQLEVKKWEMEPSEFAVLLPDSQQDLSAKPILREDITKQNPE